jgi:hypothetical protein
VPNVLGLGAVAASLTLLQGSSFQVCTAVCVVNAAITPITPVPFRFLLLLLNILYRVHEKNQVALQMFYMVVLC